MMSATVVIARLILLILVTPIGDSSANGGSPDTSTPEAAIQAYYKGYSLGDPSMIEATFLKPVVIEPLGLGDPVHYQILKKKTVTGTPLLPTIRPGDVELEVISETQMAGGKRVTLMTTFFLRKVSDGWRIVSYASELTPP